MFLFSFEFPYLKNILSCSIPYIKYILKLTPKPPKNIKICTQKNQSFHTNTSRLFCFEKIHMSFSMIPGRAFVTNPLSFIDNMGQEISVFILATLMCNRTIVCPIFTWITTTPTLAMKLPFF